MLLYSQVIFSSGFVQDFFFIFDALQSEFDMLWCRYFDIYPALYFMTFLDLCVVWCLVLIWGNSQSLLFKIFLVFIFSFLFLYSHYTYVLPFIVDSQFVHILLYFFPPIFFFSLIFSFGSFDWHTLKLSYSFLSYDQSTKEPIKYPPFLLQCFSISIISSWFFDS